MNTSQKILQSWKANADNWISTIDGNEIESRKLVTNAAIANAIEEYKPVKVLDIGCGEGWLTRELQLKGISACGIDAVEELISNAIEKGGENYFVYSYEDVVADKCKLVSEVDAVVINFALLDKELTEQLLSYLRGALKKGSLVFIQTLHPINIAINDTYESGWKDGSWNGLTRTFCEPYQWYFRTLQDWVKLFNSSRLILQELREPVHPVSKKPASVIFVLSV